MPIAARPPQYSDPFDSISLIIEDFSIEDVEFNLDQKRYIEFNLETDIEFSLELLNSVFFEMDELELDISTSAFQFWTENFEFYDEIQFDLFQNYTEQLIPFVSAPPVDNGDAVGRLDNLEHDLAKSSTNPQFYKEFTYSGDNLTGITIYQDASKLQTIYNIVFAFSGENLVSKTITRISDGRQLIVGFNYSGENLISQTRTIV